VKATGIVRYIDNLGRIVIPKELRNTYGITEGTPMEIFTSGDSIILKKYQPEAWSNDELKDALVAVCNEIGKDPVDYLNAVRIHQKEGSATE
jgi:transcriptional pleiotropic regulator of transition state genes